MEIDAIQDVQALREQRRALMYTLESVLFNELHCAIFSKRNGHCHLVYYDFAK